MMDLLGTVLAYRPFIDTLEQGFKGADAMQIYFVIPLIIAISIIYKATKVADLKDLPRHAAIMSGQILVVLVLAAVGLYVVVSMLVHKGPPG